MNNRCSIAGLQTPRWHRRRHALGVILLLLAAMPAAAQQNSAEWSVLFPKGSDDNMSVVCIGDSIGIVTAARQHIRRSSDAGRTWHDINIAPSSITRLRALSFAGANGMVVGDEGTVARSRDKGATWQACASPNSTLRILAIACLSRDTAICAGDTGAMYLTCDGGDRWTRLLLPAKYTIASLSFPDANTGYAATDGGIILKSTDRGARWRVLQTGADAPLGCVHFIDALHGCATGYNVIVTTSDGGTTWEASASRARGIAMLNPSTVLLANQYAVFRSEDSARTWTPVATEPTSWCVPNAVAWGSNGFALAVGSNALILTSSDSGRTWWQHDGIVGSILSPSLAFPDPAHGFLCGAGDRVYRTLDSGNSWQRLVAPVPANAFRMHFPSPDTGWIGCDSGIVLCTTNGGAQWTRVNTGASTPLLDVRFFDARNGLAVGEYGTILRSSDGGFRWSRRWPGTWVRLTGVRWTDSSTAVATGFDGTVLRSTDGGWLWDIMTTMVHPSMNSLSFTDASSGSTFGLLNTFLQTSDGGLTWRERRTPTRGTPVTMRCGAFADADWGVAWNNGRGGLLQSLDGGGSWSDYTVPSSPSSYSAPIESAAFPTPSIGYVAIAGFHLIRGIRSHNGMGRLSVSSGSIGFGPVFPGSRSLRRMTVANTGDAPLYLIAMEILGPDATDFALSGFSPVSLQPRTAGVPVDVICRPAKHGRISAILRIRSGDPVTPQRDIPLEAFVGQEDWSIAPDTLRFGDVLVGGDTALTVTLTAPDSLPHPIPAIEVLGADTRAYRVSGVDVDSLSRPWALTVTVHCMPPAEGSVPESWLRFSKGGVLLPGTHLPLSARGVTALLDVSPPVVDLGAVAIGRHAEADIVLKNRARSALSITSVALEGPRTFTLRVVPDSILAGGDSARVTVRFTPDSVGAYNALLRVSHSSLLSGSGSILLPVRGSGYEIPSAAQQTSAPEQAALGLPYPLPPSASITVPFSLASRSHARLALHDALGRRVAVLADDSFAAGGHTRSFDTSQLPAGLYMMVLEAGSGGRHTRRFIIAR